MDINTVLELVKAGFTHDEIIQMEQGTAQNPNTESVPDAAPTPTPTQEPTQAQVAEPVATPTPVAKPVQQEAQPSMADIMEKIAQLTSAVQANAIAQSVIPQGLQNQPSAEDMIAEIIRPTFKERI